MADAATSKLNPAVQDEDHIRGPWDAPVTLVEYGDYECPHCRQVAPILIELRQRFGDRLRYVFRHLPLTTMHPNAQLAAEAAEAAGAQGKFWEMHDLLFEHEGALGKEHMVDSDTVLILISGETAAQLGPDFEIQEVQELVLRGRHTPTRIFKLTGIGGDDRA